MKSQTQHDLPFQPHRASRRIGACIAYFATVCASMAATAAVVTEAAPFLVTGF